MKSATTGADGAGPPRRRASRRSLLDLPVLRVYENQGRAITIEMDRSQEQEDNALVAVHPIQVAELCRRLREVRDKLTGSRRKGRVRP